MASLTTRKILLRNRAGEVVAEALVDDEDYERVMAAGRWSLAKRGCAYRRISRGPRGAVIQTEVKMHRFVLGLSPEDPLVDHIDRNPLNNTKTNLRLATVAQNSQNRQSISTGSSRFRGVYWQSDIKRWRAKVQVGGQAYYLGTFTDEKEAGRVAAEWRAEHMPFSQETLWPARV